MSLCKTFVFFLTMFLATAYHGEEWMDLNRNGRLDMYEDPNKSIEERADDLIARMTLEEKIGEMTHDAPGVERLGIHPYNWWNECLHGVARAGTATVFPQAVGLAAAWNMELVREVGEAISLEGRAKHHEAVRRGSRGIYEGLTFWTPNINIFRDPRWGRGQETYGEDPFLTYWTASVFVNALQGDNDKYFKSIATLKHYAVHSGPESSRHSFDAKVDELDSRETYLFAFEKTLKKAKPYSVMGAYNRVNGEPCCSDSYLLGAVLRDEWGFDGYVVSDCGAISDIWSRHRVVPTPEEAAARAVKAGCDLNCGDVYPHLLAAVKEGLITEDEINVSLKRLLKAKIKLGFFDPPEHVEYSKIPYETVDCPEHDRLALKAAGESMVLLKNEEWFLPLDDSIQKIAVIGPNADNLDVLLGNYHGTPSHPVTFLEGIKEEFKDKEVFYEKGCELFERKEMELVSIPSKYLFFRDEDKKEQRGLLGEYYDNEHLKKKPLMVRADDNIDFNWRASGPAKDFPSESFSVSWKGFLTPPVSGEYWLGVKSDDGFRLYLDEELVIDDWNYHSVSQKKISVTLDSSKTYSIRVEYFEGGGDASVRLGWLKPGDSRIIEEEKEIMRKKVLEIAKKSQAVIFCAGISPMMEGEEMDVEIDGFSKGDRTSLELPAVQMELLKELNKLNVPIALVLNNGGAVAFDKNMKNLKAVVETWYPGQNGGAALAKILSGKINPSGKLPVTFYHSLENLPSFEDYEMKNQTYRLYRDSVLFPFGYGLSYSEFEYSSLKTVASLMKEKDTLSFQFKLKNKGKYAGYETPQFYLLDLKSGDKVYLKTLRGFKKVFLNPGEEKEVEFKITAEDLEIWRIGQGWKTLPGKYRFAIGSSSADFHLKGEFEYR